MPTLTLYHLPACPYCHRVRRAADRLSIPLQLLDVRANPEARAHLQRELGRGTVPVLGISEGETEQLLPESADIVRWLEAHAKTVA